MGQEISYTSYLLRIWRDGDAPDTWQGEIESIQTGQTWQFADLVTMADFLQGQVLGEPTIESDQERDRPGGC